MRRPSPVRRLRLTSAGSPHVLQRVKRLHFSASKAAMRFTGTRSLRARQELPYVRLSTIEKVAQTVSEDRMDREFVETMIESAFTASAPPPVDQLVGLPYPFD